MTTREHGLTLLELLTTTAVVAIVAGLCFPSLVGLRERMQASTTSHAITASLMTARMAAVTRRRPVSVCPSADGMTCDGAGDWGNGWIVFVDHVRSGQPQGAADVLQRADSMADSVDITASHGRPLVRYQPSGLASGSNISFRLCSGAGSRLLARIVVANSGRARTERPARPVACA